MKLTSTKYQRNSTKNITWSVILKSLMHFHEASASSCIRLWVSEWVSPLCPNQRLNTGLSGTGTIAKQVGYYCFKHQTKLSYNPVEIKSCSKLQRTLIIVKVNKLYLYFQLVHVLAVGTNNICSKLFFGKGRMYKNKLVLKYTM